MTGSANRVASASGGLRHSQSTHVVVQKLSAALQARRFSLKQDRGSLSRACILLTSGTGEIGGVGETITLQSPALAWLPVEPGHYLRVLAGTQGYVIWFSDIQAKNSLGDHAESAQLRYLIDRPVVAVEIGNEEFFAEVEHAFAAIDKEIRKSERGSWVYLSAQITIILVHCWRISGLEQVAMSGHSTNATILLRFRNLVELHFKEQWTIARYAKELEISHDRLHDISVRTLQRTPLQLVHERLTYEAGRRLVHSGFTIEQIAADLGFPTTSYFSRFFARQTELSPGRYRREAGRKRLSSSSPQADGFADWP
ncbi:MAG: helix-turn-helix domain-containing protein [Rhodocyclales bacterium]|nr:helix-turn-helix domain-containing protein [Rhodocyclales bacterium]